MDDVVKGPGFLDDHAFVCAAALDLYEATGAERYLTSARAIADRTIARFWDDADAGFFYTPSDAERLIVRSKDPFDQAIPSGGSIACSALSKLASIADEKYGEYARRHLESIAPAAADNPFAFGQTIGVLDRLVRGSTDVVILGPSDDRNAKALHRAALSAYLPNRNVVWADPGRPSSMEATARLTSDKPHDAHAVAYVCRNRTCSAPVRTVEELTTLLRST
jgi:uncharacterized protein YyaL (SSP411 family)